MKVLACAVGAALLHIDKLIASDPVPGGRSATIRCSRQASRCRLASQPSSTCTASRHSRSSPRCPRSAATSSVTAALFSLIYREAIRNDKVTINPARLVHQKNEGSGRIRYLLDDEERALRATVLEMFPDHLPELVIAIGAGMRKSEQFRLDWSQLDLGWRVIHLRKTKNYEAREVPMNSRCHRGLRNPPW